MNICNYYSCTGCGLCSEICKKQCISMIENKEGFLYPAIDVNKCVSCGLCRELCPMNNLVEKNNEVHTAISAWSKDDKERFSSSSGGIFPELAKQVLNCGGVVYGAAFDIKHSLKHIRIDDLTDLKLLKGSKYFQSDIRDCYKMLKSDLIDGRDVLFSGTGCQIAAIKRYLGNTDLSKFLAVEILCHGVPSKKIVDSCIKSINPNIKPLKLNFRDKSKYGWEYSCVFEVDFENGDKHYGRSSTDLFYLGFLNELFLRESCYSCPFVGKSRIGDVTLADYWRVTKEDVAELSDEDMQKGVSLVLVNNDKGEQAIRSLVCADRIVCHGANLEKASEHNQALQRNYKRPEQRDVFFIYNDKYGYSKALFRIYPKTIVGIQFRQFVKKLIGERYYSKLKSMLMKG